MILTTNIETTNRGATFEKTRNGRKTSRVKPGIASASFPERWLVVIGSDDAQAQCLSNIQQFANVNAELHFMKPVSPDPASEVRRLAIALEADWIWMVAERGPGMMSLFLRSEAESILRAAPCPVVCIPEVVQSVGARPPANAAAVPVRRVLAPIKLSRQSRRQVENAVAVAMRFGTKLDLLGVDERPRDSGGLRPSGHREVRRRRIRTMKRDLTELAEAVIPQRLRGRILVSVGLPLFHATSRWAQELNSSLIMHAVPTQLWRRHGRIDLETERILHEATGPVICVPEHDCALDQNCPEVLCRIRRQPRRRDWPIPSRRSLRRDRRPTTKFQGLGAAQRGALVATTNPNRFNAYETQIIGS
jgi:nucleotide-binding universal stress UspA family protein